MYKMNGERFPTWAKYTVKYVTPVMSAIILIVSFIGEYSGDVWEGKPYWAKFLGRFMMYLPFAVAILGLKVKIKSPTMEELIKEQYSGTLEEIKEDLKKDEKFF